MGNDAFTDYYEVLQVSPNADRETIDRVYRFLARRYHPDNAHTGDPEKFDALTKAYRILSDREKRAIFDAEYEGVRGKGWGIFFQASPTESAERDKKIYQAILSILYLARRRSATKPGVGIVTLENLLGFPEKDLEFHIWYLKEKGWIERVDTGGYAVTVAGVEAVIEKDLLLRKDRYLTDGSEPLPRTESAKELDPADRSLTSALGESGS